MKQTLKATLEVLAAGILWGFMGLFVRTLNGAGMTALNILCCRAFIGFLCCAGYLLLFDRHKLRVRLKDLWCFFGTGVISLLGFSWCYYTGMTMASLSIMAVLLYTAPVFVMLFSAVLFREKLTRNKLAALVLTILGCALVSGIGSDTVLSRSGLLLGLGSGFFYSLYSIFGTCASRRGYSPWTITCYTFLFCGAGCLLISNPMQIADAVAGGEGILVWITVMGITTGFLAYLLYTAGLAGLEPGRAAMIASIEPVAATLVGVFCFSEQLPLTGLLGICCVLGGIVLLGGKRNRK